MVFIARVIRRFKLPFVTVFNNDPAVMPEYQLLENGDFQSNRDNSYVMTERVGPEIGRVRQPMIGIVPFSLTHVYSS